MGNLSPHAPWLQNQKQERVHFVKCPQKWLSKKLFLKNFKKILSEVTVDHQDMMGEPGIYQQPVLQVKIKKIQHRRRIQVLSLDLLHLHREDQVLHQFQIYNQQLCKLHLRPLQRRGNIWIPFTNK